MSIESLRERARNFIENQKKKMLEDWQARLGFTLVAQVKETLGVSLVNPPLRENHQSDPDYLFWGQLVQFIQKSFSIQSLANPELRTSGELDAWVAINLITGAIETWRDSLGPLSAEEFTQKLANYKVKPDGELMTQLLTRLRYAPEGRSYPAVLEGTKS